VHPVSAMKVWAARDRGGAGTAAVWRVATMDLLQSQYSVGAAVPLSHSLGLARRAGAT
jgi:hypothetical protein